MKTKACVDRIINRTPLTADRSGRERLAKIRSLNDRTLSFISPTVAVFWDPGVPIKVRFLEGDPSLQKKYRITEVYGQNMETES